ncbi:MAG: sigma-54 dependent transcriptional regulator [Vicinamibacteria bacterium]|nr:sigma-54 dependent transcriptional regulator [Vicinamibacteria bacterium]
MADRSLVLVVDDDADLRAGIGRYLRAIGYDVAEAESGKAALREVSASLPDIIILDVNLPDASGIELLDQLRERAPSTPVIMLTGDASISIAVDAIKHGAENFLTKPVDSSALALVIERSLAHRTNRLKALATPAADGSPDPFRGTSEDVQRLRREATRLLSMDRPVLITGETGSGKGVLARWLHANGPRAREAFVDLNCAGLSRDLLESELFGHEAGAFTGANRRKIGLIEEAHRGTLFLDELAEMDLAVQAKLLKALEDRRIRPLGGTREKTVDFRLIAATHRDLRAMSLDGRFREDLFFRISAFPLRVPALRERRGDVADIAATLLASFAAEIGRPRLRLSPGAIEALQARHWRGNIRELRNAIERAGLFAETDIVDESAIDADEPRPPAQASSTPSAEEVLSLDEVERRHILSVLKAEKNRVLPAAKKLGIARSSLYEKLRRFGISITETEQASEDRS